MASRRGHPDIVRWLLAKGASAMVRFQNPRLVPAQLLFSLPPFVFLYRILNPQLSKAVRLRPPHS